MKDSSGDAGTWGFSLTVSATKISQVGPTSAATTVGENFTGQLRVSGSHGTLTYTQSTGASDLKVSSAGKISAAATLAAGTYKATGLTKDTYGDTGAWKFALTVTANKITQIAPTAATTELGKAFAGQLDSAGAHGTVTYTQSSGAPHLTVSPSGAIRAEATLPAGSYKATGTTRDTLGDAGTWSFTLTVIVTVTKLSQIAPMAATIPAGKAFTGQLEVSGSRGAATYAQLSGAPDLTVSSSGEIRADATLAAGSYKANGTVKDASGDSGTWSFDLTVTVTVDKAQPDRPDGGDDPGRKSLHRPAGGFGLARRGHLRAAERSTGIDGVVLGQDLEPGYPGDRHLRGDRLCEGQLRRLDDVELLFDRRSHDNHSNRARVRYERDSQGLCRSARGLWLSWQRRLLPVTRRA